jgi:CrcB protein
MIPFLWVAIGGAVGAVLRYSIHLLIIHWYQGSFPLATLLVNAFGGLAIGFLWSSMGNDQLRLFLLVGLLGGFTTFSSFSLETMRLWQNGMHLTGLLYILLNNMISIGLCYLGYWAGKSFSL